MRVLHLRSLVFGLRFVVTPWPNQTIKIKDAYASSGMCPHKLFLFSDHLHQVCKRIYAVSFAISCKIVMSKYNLLVSLSMTHSSMIMWNGPHSDHAQVKVGYTQATDTVK